MITSPEKYLTRCIAAGHKMTYGIKRRRVSSIQHGIDVLICNMVSGVRFRPPLHSLIWLATLDIFGCHYYLVLVDNYSRYIEVMKLNDLNYFPGNYWSPKRTFQPTGMVFQPNRWSTVVSNTQAKMLALFQKLQLKTCLGKSQRVTPCKQRSRSSF